MESRELIRQLCKEQNVTISELARRIGQTRQNLTKKIDRETLTLEELQQIANALEVYFNQSFILPNGKVLQAFDEKESLYTNKASKLINALEQFSLETERNHSVSKEEIVKLLDLYRQFFAADFAYVIVNNTQGNGFKFVCVSTDSQQYQLTGSTRALNPQEMQFFVSLFDKDGISQLKDKSKLNGKMLNIIQFGAFRHKELDGCVGLLSFDEQRVWSDEAKVAVLRLGRTLHQPITALRMEALAEEQKKEVEHGTKLTALLLSMTKVYSSVHILNLERDTVVELATFEYLQPYVGENIPASKQVHDAFYYNCVEEDRERLLKFADLSTLKARMKNRKVLSYDFRGLHYGWMRAEFIEVERSENGELLEVAITSKCIETEKQREEYLIKLSSTDELTQLLNRHSYETEIERLERNSLPEDLVIGAFDVNGLKRANDNIGHAAGDELIKATALALNQIFGKYGPVYRTGGDEFMCLLRIPSNEIPALVKELREYEKNWHGDYNVAISISAGFASVIEYKDMPLNVLLKIADKQMYEDKTEFYRTHGNDRRKR